MASRFSSQFSKLDGSVPRKLTTARPRSTSHPTYPRTFFAALANTVTSRTDVPWCSELRFESKT